MKTAKKTTKIAHRYPNHRIRGAWQEKIKQPHFSHIHFSCESFSFAERAPKIFNKYSEAVSNLHVYEC